MPMMALVLLSRWNSAALCATRAQNLTSASICGSALYLADLSLRPVLDRQPLEAGEVLVVFVASTSPRRWAIAAI